MRRLIWLLVVSIFVGLGNLQPPPRPLSLVLLSIDGLRPDYVLEADRYGLKIPHLRQLVRDGAYATGVRGVLPTVTFPSHTTIVTGVPPVRHGIFANTTFDPMMRNLDGWQWYAEDITVPTLWDVATQAGFVTSNVEWPATAGARITYNLPSYWRAKTPDDQKLYRLLATPGLLPEVEAAVGPYPPSYEWTVAFDVRRAAVSGYLIAKKKPRLHLAYFAALDEEEHDSGPFSAKSLAVLERIDDLVGQLRAAADQNGPSVFAVVSDHGFNATTREVHLNEALREEGLILLDGRGRVTAWRASAWMAGGSAAVMLEDAADAQARQSVQRMLDRLAADPDSGVARVLTQAEAVAAGGYPDAAFVVGLKPGFRMGSSLEPPVVRGGDLRGAHGMLPEDPAMDASFFIAGPGIPANHSLGRIDMLDIAPTLAARLRLDSGLLRAEGRDRLAQ
jgi:predicted AlkP superfamily pyrophosphatase or phosphodiesterase